MKLEILLSCMYQEDLTIIDKSRITGDVLIINQTDCNDFCENNSENRRVRMYSTTERGLSRSRNMAIYNSDADVCVLSDDDEVFEENYDSIILENFGKIRDADVIAFDVQNKVTRLGTEVCYIGYLKSLRLSSCQLAFRRKSIVDKKIEFDVLMGTGTGNGCGEENKFLLDCLRAGLKIYYVPVRIAGLEEKESTWFSGFDEKFFYQRGSSTRYMPGLMPAMIYGLYYIVTKKKMYQDTISMKAAACALAKGIKDNNIYRQKKGRNG